MSRKYLFGRNQCDFFLSEMNRTSEFFTYLSNAGPQNVSAPRNQKLKSKFFELADEISSQIAQTSSICNRLNTLVSGDNILGEDDKEISELMIMLKVDIENIEQQINTAERMQREAPQAGLVAQQLRKSLLEINTQFRSVVEKRAHITSQTAAKRSKYGGYTYARQSFNTVYNNDDEIEIPINQLQQEENNLIERLGLVRDVESSITSIAQMMARLSTVIADQDTTIMRIDESTLEALNNMKAGESELTKYRDKVMKNKWFILKIFVVLFIFALIFILIV